jgi:hypothetical protein
LSARDRRFRSRRARASRSAEAVAATMSGVTTDPAGPAGRSGFATSLGAEGDGERVSWPDGWFRSRKALTTGDRLPPIPQLHAPPQHRGYCRAEVLKNASN